MRKALNLVYALSVFVLLAGCTVAPPTVVSTKSYIGKDFSFKKKDGFRNIVMLLPSNMKNNREISDYRGVYGAFANNINFWNSPFYKMNVIADWDNNENNYNNKENILVKIKLNDYDLNEVKDSSKCVAIETIFSVYPFSQYSVFIYDGANCSGITDVRFLSKVYMYYMNDNWNNEKYSTHLVEFMSIDRVNYSEVVDKLLGFSP